MSTADFGFLRIEGSDWEGFKVAQIDFDVIRINDLIWKGLKSEFGSVSESFEFGAQITCVRISFELIRIDFLVS